MLLKGPGRQGAPRACSLNHFLAQERGWEPLALAVGESGPSHAASPGDPPATSPPGLPAMPVTARCSPVPFPGPARFPRAAGHSRRQRAWSWHRIRPARRRRRRQKCRERPGADIRAERGLRAAARLERSPAPPVKGGPKTQTCPPPASKEPPSCSASSSTRGAAPDGWRGGG